jgi:hypothetical protein
MYNSDWQLRMREQELLLEFNVHVSGTFNVLHKTVKPKALVKFGTEILNMTILLESKFLS